MKFTYLFRKYPLFRGALVFILVVIIFLSVVISSIESMELPVITSIEPKIGVPGDIMIINGTGFGDIRDTSTVEIGGSALTSSSYLLWTNTQIKVLLPTNMQDGLVHIITQNGKSEPHVFTNKENIPIAIQQEHKNAFPTITTVDQKNISVGQILTIKGNNFGSIRNNSSVCFTPSWTNGKAPSQDAMPEDLEYIQAFENNYDYEYWSNTEIQVRIPDGTSTGYFFVKTDKGESNRHRININSPIGTKKLSNKIIYLIELTADISDIKTDEDSLITLRIPRPQESISQPYIQLTSCTPKPVYENHNKTIIHHFQTGVRVIREEEVIQPSEKYVFSQNFVIPVFTVTTNINPTKIKPITEKNRLLYKIYTSSDQCIPSDNGEIIKLAKSIIEKEINPYLQAKKIYKYIIDNFTLSTELNQNETELSILQSKSGDAYDFSILFCSLARAVGIPTIPISGILVDIEKKSQNHWWNEIYIENFGWVPIDIALGANLDFPLHQEPTNRQEYYFGNIDSQHIAFSRGWNNIKPTIINNKTVYRPKTFALQSIWEETTAGTVSYSSFWSDPVVTGIY